MNQHSRGVGRGMIRNFLVDLGLREREVGEEKEWKWMLGLDDSLPKDWRIGFI
jgi:hypothetical protein